MLDRLLLVRVLRLADSAGGVHTTLHFLSRLTLFAEDRSNILDTIDKINFFNTICLVDSTKRRLNDCRLLIIQVEVLSMMRMLYPLLLIYKGGVWAAPLTETDMQLVLVGTGGCAGDDLRE